MKSVTAKELKKGDIITMKNFWIKNRIVNRIKYDDSQDVVYTQLITQNNEKENVVIPYSVVVEIKIST